MLEEIKETTRKLDDLVFVAECTATYKTFDDAINNLRAFLVRPETINPDDIDFIFDNTAQFKIGEDYFPATKWAVESLCKVLKIPNPFSKVIPLDLLCRNIRRLSKLYPKDTLTANFDVNNNLIGFTPLTYRPIKTIDLLPRLAARFGDASENLKIDMSTRNIIIQFTRDVTGVRLEPQVGDATKCGLEIVNSELNDLDACSSIFLLRLACTNGVTLTEGWGTARRNKNNKIQYETVLDQFVQDCGALQTDYRKLGLIYNKLPEMTLNSNQFVKTFQILNGLFGKESAARIILSDPDEVKDIQAFENKRTRWGANLSEYYGRLPRDTGKNAYDVFNNITETARDLSNMNTARQVRVFSGRYLWTIAKDLDDAIV